MSATVTTSTATRYTVRNGWAWAYIFVDHGIEPAPNLTGRERRWVNVSVISDYGSFGFCWSHIGGDWREFLASLDMHYAMNKMLGPHFRVEMSGDEAARQARKIILDDRRARGGISREEARSLWDAVDLADQDNGARAFFRSWDSWADGKPYDREYYSDRWDKVNPQAEGFWLNIWPHFVAAICPAATASEAAA